MQKEFNKKVSVEDLLHLKRQEKPDPQFWDTFDRELKQKTLKALIKRPSLRSRLGRVLILSLRPLLPIAVTAVVALGFMNHHDISFTSTPIAQHLASSSTSRTLASWDSTSFESMPKHYVKNILSSQSSLSSEGMHYLAGNISRTGIATAIKSNTLF